MPDIRHPAHITVVGAGITGLWQALTLARRGHRVRLVEASAAPFADAASGYAGAMLGPFCETEVYAPVVTALGLESMRHWRETFPGTVLNGTLVVAAARDTREVEHFARLTEGYERTDGEAIARLEPDLAGRFSSGLLYAQEGHLEPRAAMQFLLDESRRAGVEIALRNHLAGRQAARATAPSSIAAGSAPGRTCPVCAACAASGSSCARARSLSEPPGAAAAPAPPGLRGALGRRPLHDRRHAGGER